MSEKIKLMNIKISDDVTIWKEYEQITKYAA